MNDLNIWHEMWRTNKIGFHLSEVNPLLQQHFKKLNLEKGSRIFLPLCGKTLDIQWLLKEGYIVVGAELSEDAIKQLFLELNVEANILEIDDFKIYSTQNLKIFVGNFFDLDKDILKDIDAIYDRAALVALPEEARTNYTKHLREITKSKPQLMLNYVYEQSLMNGPPFSVPNDEVKKHYQKHYNMKLIDTVDIVKSGRKPDAKENVWILK